MFRGAHELTIDSKGRLAIPAKFREVLSREFAEDDDQVARIVVTLENRDRLLFYPESRWCKIEQDLLNLRTAGKPNLEKYRNLVLHNADTLEIDSAGRVLVPALLRGLVGLDKDVILVGRVDRLELWDRSRKLAETEDALAIDADELNFDLGQVDFQL
ncbi:MAG: division/cell wall cluster transcriptional repressor MraZ [Neisseriaceae bacterium]|nr:division/cell wall cluster transcriptional repressor MraZ [Neisseriaceae bacterium]MBR6876646.1 division/cell wall cluster transcriptional repressor MraZ [Neisseriaceae bacterium]